MTDIFTIEEDPSLVPLWEAKIAKANAKAERAGLGRPFAIAGRGTTETTVTKAGIKVPITLATLTILAPTPSVDGWELAATLDWHSTSTVVVRVSPTWGTDPLPRPTDQRCDHCGTLRERHDTYLVSNGDEVKQVGSSCLEAYTGIHLGWVSAFQNIGDPLDEADIRAFHSKGGRSISRTVALTLAIALVDAKGFVSAKASSDRGVPSTRRDVELLAFGPYNKADRDYADELKALIASRTRSDEAIADEVADIVAWAAGLSGNDYLDNLRAILADEVFGDRSLGFAVSAVSARRREVAKAVAKAAAPPRTVLPSATGRYTIVGTVRTVRGEDTPYGFVIKARIETDSGSVVWGTLPKAISDALVGDRVQFSAAIEVSKDDPTFGFWSRPTKAIKIA